MIKKLLTFGWLLAVAASAQAITYTYGNLDATAGTCTLMSWGGSQPTSGKLTLKETYEENGVTYRVTAIAPHALDNLTQVTQITIPANVERIGDAYCRLDSDGGKSYRVAPCHNFNNCPELRLFYVAQGSKYFMASGAGVLMFSSNEIIVKVPQKVAVTSGRFDMANNIDYVCEDAFAENSTIKVLGFSTHLRDAADLGLSTMTALTDFAISGNLTSNFLTVSSGALLSADKTKLFSFPPYRPVPSFSVPGGVKVIEASAFANCSALYQVDLPASLENIGKYAFANSGITNIDIPNHVTEIGKGALSNCSRLTKLTVRGYVALPADFARDCNLLTSVNLSNSVTKVGDCAFKNCSRLTSFPFSAAISFDADSVFANCGFKEVVFRPSQIGENGFDLSAAMFYGNHSLELLDMTDVKAEIDGNSNLLFFKSFAIGDCPALKTVKLPSGVSFTYRPTEFSPNFGINTAVETLVMGSFVAVDRPIIYYNQGHHTPKVYMQTTDSKMRRWELDLLFQTAGSATCTPEIYCEGYTMSDIQGHANEYVVPEANYHIPGGTTDNYSQAVKKSKSVLEMYRYRPVNNNGKFRLNISRTIPELEFTRISINNATQDIGMPDAYGAIITDIPVDNVDNVTVEYTVNGIAMKTFYPEIGLKSGIGYVTDDTHPLTVTVSGNTAYFGNICQYSVADMSGRIIITGNDDNADLSGLTAGVYIINAIDADHHKVTRKHTVR